MRLRLRCLRFINSRPEARNRWCSLKSSPRVYTRAVCRYFKRRVAISTLLSDLSDLRTAFSPPRCSPRRPAPLLLPLAGEPYVNVAALPLPRPAESRDRARTRPPPPGEASLRKRSRQDQLARISRLDQRETYVTRVTNADCTRSRDYSLQARPSRMLLFQADDFQGARGNDATHRASLSRIYSRPPGSDLAQQPSLIGHGATIDATECERC
jgi:hypothetical protein